MSGAVAQLGEHHNGIVGVKGSNPFSSTWIERWQLYRKVAIFAFLGLTSAPIWPILLILIKHTMTANRSSRPALQRAGGWCKPASVPAHAKAELTWELRP